MLELNSFVSYLVLSHAAEVVLAVRRLDDVVQADRGRRHHPPLSSRSRSLKEGDNRWKLVKVLKDVIDQVKSTVGAETADPSLE